MAGAFEIQKPSSNIMVDEKITGKTGYYLIQTVDTPPGLSNSSWALPLPNQLDYSASWDWEQFATKSYTEAAMTSSVAEGLNIYLTKMGQTLSNLPYKSVSDYYQQYVDKKAFNENVKLYFNGQNLEEFQLSFDLIPFSEEHNQKIIRGINSLIIYSSADYKENITYWDIPAKYASAAFAPADYSNGPAPNKQVMRHSSFAIRGISFTSSEASHKDGYPVSYSLQLSCVETNFISHKEREIF